MTRRRRASVCICKQVQCCTCSVADYTLAMGVVLVVCLYVVYKCTDNLLFFIGLFVCFQTNQRHRVEQTQRLSYDSQPYTHKNSIILLTHKYVCLCVSFSMSVSPRACVHVCLLYSGSFDGGKASAMWAGSRVVSDTSLKYCNSNSNTWRKKYCDTD